jgi:hypothetical protein
MLQPEDMKLLAADGINIYDKIQRLQKAIDVKQPIIKTTEGNIIAFLTGSVSNTGNVDATIRHMDLSQFEKGGIPLQYSRDDFMQKMNELKNEFIAVSTGSPTVTTKDAVIPELKLTEDDVESTKVYIEELNQSKPTTKVKVIMNGKTYNAIRFEGTQGGSNKAYYTQIGEKLYYIKYPDESKLGQSIEEVIASQLYRVAGIDSPNMEYIYDEEGKVIGLASEHVPNAHMPSDNTFAYDTYAVDAWLNDWDAPLHGNTKVRNGRSVVMDPGGSMHYRAKGEQKSFEKFPDALVTLIDFNSSLYSNMTKADILASLKHVTEIPNESIVKVIKDSPSQDIYLAETLIKRKDFISVITYIQMTVTSRIIILIDILNILSFYGKILIRLIII